MTLSIIIVSYNTAQLTVDAVNSVLNDLASYQPLAEKTEIIIVDNNSHDDSKAMLKRLAKSSKVVPISLIYNQENLGFAQANNQGIKQATGEFILLLNSDTRVQPGALTQLINSFTKHPLDGTTARLSSHQGKLDHLGILAASLLNEDGSYQPQGGSLPTLTRLAVQMLLLDDLPLIGKLLPTVQETGLAGARKTHSSSQLQQKGWVAGTAMMIRRQVIEEVGMLDPNIFMYGEDIEFCLRAKNKHWDVALDPQAKVVHLGSASSSSEQAIWGEIKAYLYIWAKHKPHWQRRFLKMILYLGIVLRICLYRFAVKNKKLAKTYQQALNLLD